MWKSEHAKFVKEKKIVSKELKLINTSLKLSRTLKSNKELTYRILAQVALVFQTELNLIR